MKIWANGDDGSGFYQKAIDQTIDDIKAMIATIRKQNQSCMIVLVGMNPVNGDPPPPNPEVLAKDPYAKQFCMAMDARLKQAFAAWYEVEYVSCVQSVVPRKEATGKYLMGDPDWENTLQMDHTWYFGPHISDMGNLLLSKVIYRTILYMLRERKSYNIRLDEPIPKHEDRLTRSEELYIHKIMKKSTENFYRGLRR
jgi:hypothetical protein